MPCLDMHVGTRHRYRVDHSLPFFKTGNLLLFSMFLAFVGIECNGSRKFSTTGATFLLQGPAFYCGLDFYATGLTPSL